MLPPVEIKKILPRPLPKTLTRLSVYENILTDCSAYEVTLNGEIEKLCTEADVKQGYIKRYVANVEGHVNPPKGDSLLTETLYGVVTIKLRDDYERK